MDYISTYKKQLYLRMSLYVLLPIISVVLAIFGAIYVGLESTSALIIGGSVGLFMGVFSIAAAVNAAATPMDTVQRILAYASNNATQTEVPKTDTSIIGRQLLEALSRQIYTLASNETKANLPAAGSVIANNSPDVSTPNNQSAVQTSQSSILDALSVPVLGTDSNQIIVVANAAAKAYFNDSALVGKRIYDALNLSFQGVDSIEQWALQAKQSSVTANKSWERVRHTISDDAFKQFDLSASFSSGSETGIELLIALYDKTEKYGLDDQELSLVALAVHELRTPLTIMRGYVEVFQDELGPSLEPELKDFMHKMQASTQQLTAFVGNILNVARVEENQLFLRLREEKWGDILYKAVDDLQLRAQVHGITLELSVSDNLPTVGADKISAHEIINNLVDNAIKYSNGATKIIISSTVNSDGNVETSVQDFGIGIPAAVMGTLFEKYHRSHKSRTQVGGTGLGLFLCRALVAAHGGNIWVRSKEGEGSIFSFTILPYAKLSNEQLSGEDGIVRGAHGWIKNHSLYRN